MARKQDQSPWAIIGKGAAIGAGVSMLMTVALTALAAALVGHQTVGESSVGILTLGILILSAGAGGVIGCACTGHHRLAVSVASGCAYYLGLLACSALLFDGVFKGAGPTALAVMGSSAAVALLGLKEGKRSYSNHRVKKRNW